MKTIVTHSGNFHTDDVFATATLLLYFEKIGEEGKIIRSFDKEIIEKGDFVHDIGLIYNPKKNRFDHHQEGAAGERENGIKYASFGLVWKKFGKEVAGSKKAADIVDKNLVAYIDAHDNGISAYKVLFDDMKVFTIDEYVESEADIIKGLVFGEKSEMYRTYDKKFRELVDWAKGVIGTTVIKANNKIGFEKEGKKLYMKAKDKRVIVMDAFIPFGFDEFPEPLLTVYPDNRTTWSVKNVRLPNEDLKGRFYFPKSWRGKTDEALQKVTGVPDAVFCHNSGFLVVAKSKEGALKLAELALKSQKL